MAPPDSDEWSFPVAFHFGVKVDGVMTSFSEVSGIECTLEISPVKSGGDNTQCYFIPEKRTFSPLVLKRGFCKKGDPFFEWCKRILTVELSKNCIDLKDIEVMLLDENSNPLTTWRFKHAYPVKWVIDKLDSMENKLVIETVNIQYTSFDLVQG